MEAFEKRVNEIMELYKVDKTKAIFMVLNEKSNKRQETPNPFGESVPDFMKDIFGFK